MDLRRKHTEGEKTRTPWLHLAIIVFVLIIAGVVAWLLAKTDIGSGIDKDGYQLVNLTTGERFIGKLSGITRDYVVLSDVYYEQSSSKEDEGKPSEVVVARLSTSLAKPEDTMRIASDRIVHWENLQDDSKIVQAIKQDGN